jgi:hypothetical protein
MWHIGICRGTFPRCSPKDPCDPARDPFPGIQANTPIVASPAACWKVRRDIAAMAQLARRREDGTMTG